MFKQRLLTALVLAPAAIWATLALPTPAFSALVGAIFLLGAWEWAALAGFGGGARAAFSAALALAGVLLHPVLMEGRDAIIGVGVIWWLAALLMVLAYPAGTAFWRRPAWLRALPGVLILMPAWAALTLLHGQGPALALLVLLLVWGADIGAYFAGKRFGRHKLAPRVSPGKTLEGLGGALLATVAIAVGAMALLGGGVELLVLSLVAVLFSVLGDLSESLFKRLAGAKDSGGLLPGHGGVMDRIDSLTAAAPVFAAGLFWFGVTV